MPYSPKAVANAFIDIARKHGVQMSPMKLQKLIYFAHGWNLALTDAPLIDEQIEAWKFGPVIRSLYHYFKHCGNSSIEEYATITEVKNKDGRLVLERHTPLLVDHADSDFTLQLVDRIWEVYGDLSAVQLSKMTHQPGTPWHKVWEPMKDNPIKGTDIPTDLIRDWFCEQAN